MTAWVFALLMALSPPARAASLPQLPGWAETAEARESRYHDMAEDIAAVSGSASDAVALVAIAWLESGFAPDVDAFQCYRGVDGRGTRCDGGHAKSIFQVHANVETRREAAELALRSVHRSRNACGGGLHGLELYASGKCATDETPGIFAASRKRIELARKLMAEHPFTERTE